MKPVSTDVSFPEVERNILEFWEREKIFERSSTQPEGPGDSSDKRKVFVFYDGPPFATGLPHYGHLLAGTIKDVVGRFFTMKGFQVERRFGWDCHGVPVEFEIQKRLELHGAKAIREFGIGKFNEECRKIVLRYTKEWEQFVKRSGRWVDFERQYRTMDLDFMESIWWVVKSLWDKGLIFQGVKCVPYSWAINTPLSNFEANLNYKDVQDPAITVRFRLAEGSQATLGLPDSVPLYAYVWTTTPWTLPSNMAISVGKEIEYSAVLHDGEIGIVATPLLAQHFPEEREVLGAFPGEALLNLEYEPLFPYFAGEDNAFRIYHGDFVSAEDGTGLVHMASFGEDDLSIFLEHGIKIVDPVDEDGAFTSEVPDFEGQNVKEADKNIISYLKDKGSLVSHKTLEHAYPFCWRTDTPLIYKSIPTWFVKVESFRDELQQMNSLIHWVPEHLREGRMGKWLEGARDWAISRNRFWGTPLPIFSCEGCDALECLGSVAELQERSGAEVNDLHRHFIDQLTLECKSCGGVMKRVPEVLDCWFESGSMPYAQAHYPFENKEEFEERFPADFIAEGLDQTRGWFYTLLVLSTALFGRPAFKNVIVNGILLAEDGKKMSKSLKNYPPPDEVMEELGADAMRLYLLASAATRGEELRFSKEGVRLTLRQTLLPLWNAYNFLVTYAAVDGWTPKNIPDSPSQNLLDRWIVSKTASLIERVDTALSNYHLYAAVQPMLEFVDQLTNWYIRLNRRRFWGSDEQDKQHAYATLHHALLTVVRVMAPLAPFVTEEIFRNLKEDVPAMDFDSVHLAPFPKPENFQGAEVNESLEHAMEMFEQVILLTRGLRNDQKIKVRQPLKRLTVILSSETTLKELQLFDGYICDELNVKEVSYTSDESKYVTLKAQLNTKRLGKVLGPKLGSDGMKKLRNFCEALGTEEIRSVEAGGTVSFQDIELSGEDLLIRRDAKSGLDAAASSGQVTVVLDTTLTAELKLEGLAREFVNRVQKLRKDLDLEVSDRIVVKYLTADTQLSLALGEHASYICEEILAVELSEVESEDELAIECCSGGDRSPQDIDGKRLVVSLARIQG